MKFIYSIFLFLFICSFSFSLPSQLIPRDITLSTIFAMKNMTEAEIKEQEKKLKAFNEQQKKLKESLTKIMVKLKQVAKKMEFSYQITKSINGTIRKSYHETKKLGENIDVNQIRTEIKLSQINIHLQTQLKYQLEYQKMQITNELLREQKLAELILLKIGILKNRMPSSGSLCDKYMDCGSCTRNNKCGWCSMTETCMEGGPSGPKHGGCVFFSYQKCTGNADCSKHRNCKSCIKNSECGWCNKAGNPYCLNVRDFNQEECNNEEFINQYRSLNMCPFISTSFFKMNALKELNEDSVDVKVSHEKIVDPKERRKIKRKLKIYLEEKRKQDLIIHDLMRNLNRTEVQINQINRDKKDFEYFGLKMRKTFPLFHNMTKDVNNHLRKFFIVYNRYKQKRDLSKKKKKEFVRIKKTFFDVDLDKLGFDKFGRHNNTKSNLKSFKNNSTRKFKNNKNTNNKKILKHKSNKTKKHKSNKTKKHKSNKTKKHKSNKTKKHKSNKTKKHKSNKTKKHKSNKTKKHKSNKTKKHKSNKTMKHKSNKTMKHKSNKTKKHKSNNTKKHKSNNTKKHKSNNTKKHKSNNTKKHKSNKTMKHKSNKTKKHKSNKTKKVKSNKTKKHKSNKTKKHKSNKTKKHKSNKTKKVKSNKTKKNKMKKSKKHKSTKTKFKKIQTRKNNFERNASKKPKLLNKKISNNILKKLKKMKKKGAVSPLQLHKIRRTQRKKRLKNMELSMKNPTDDHNLKLSIQEELEDSKAISELQDLIRNYSLSLSLNISRNIDDDSIMNCSYREIKSRNKPDKKVAKKTTTKNPKKNFTEKQLKILNIKNTQLKNSQKSREIGNQNISKKKQPKPKKTKKRKIVINQKKISHKIHKKHTIKISNKNNTKIHKLIKKTNKHLNMIRIKKIKLNQIPKKRKIKANKRKTSQNKLIPDHIEVKNCKNQNTDELVIKGIADSFGGSLKDFTNEDGYDKLSNFENSNESSEGGIHIIQTS